RPGVAPFVFHREAHRAARLAPLEARGAEHRVEPLGLGLRLDAAGPRPDQRELPVRGDVPSARGPMNTLAIGMSVIAVLGFSPMYASARVMPSRRCSSRSRSGSGTRPST